MSHLGQFAVRRHSTVGEHRAPGKGIQVEGRSRRGDRDVVLTLAFLTLKPP